MKNTWLLFFITFLTKVPFLGLGYGAEEDSWGHVLNIFEMKMQGTYIMSRLPGHPVYEGLLYLLWPLHSPIVYNSLSALAGSFAVIAFYKIAVFFKINRPFWLALCLAFVPIVFLSSTYTIDYPIGLCFVLWSYYFLLQKKLHLSAILIALAIGTRAPWVLIIIPFVLQIIGPHPKKEDWKRGLVYTSIAGVLSILFYFPLFYNYGLGFIGTYKLPYPTYSKLIYKASLGAWGVLGWKLIMGYLLYLVKSVFYDKKKLTHIEVVWIVPIILFTLLYLRIPEKSAFFIHLIPFFILLLAYRLSRKTILVFSISMIFSGILFGFNISDKIRGSAPPKISFSKNISGQEIYFAPFEGLYVSEWKKRKAKRNYVKQVLEHIELEEKTIIIAGWWYAMLRINDLDTNKTPPHVKLVYYLPIEEMKDYLNNGYKIVYLPEQGDINDRKYESTFTIENASPFEI